jgi:hypothetical protein
LSAKSLSRIRCPCNRDHPAGESVETLDDKECRALLSFFSQFPGDFTEQADFIFVFICGNGEQASGLVDYDDMTVLVQNFEPPGEQLSLGSSQLHRLWIGLDGVTDLESESGVHHDMPGNLDPAAPDDVLDATMGEIHLRVDFSL